MPTWFAVFATALLAIMLVRLVVIVVNARKYHRSRAWLAHGEDGAIAEPPTPKVTVLVPAYNESLGIEHCLRGLAVQTYPDLEVIVIDDGSTDDTADVARSLAEEAGLKGRLTVLTKPNGGKADALNYGILHADGDFIVTVDADSVLEPDAIERLVEPLADPSVGAVGGTVRIARPTGFLGHHQTVEYISGLMLQRAAFAQNDSMQVISGALGGFRREVLRSIGGYSSDTVTEDFDVTLAVWESGYRVVFHPKAIAWTEGPGTYRDLVSQRVRWTFGGFQTLNKYRNDSRWTDDKTWQDTSHWPERNRNIKTIGIPYFAIGPWFDVLVSLLFVTTVVFVISAGAWGGFITFYAMMALIAGGVGLYALHLDGSPRWWAIFSVTMTLWYAHVLAYATLVAGIRFARGHQGSWRKLERRGANQLPVAPEPAQREVELVA